MGYPVDACRGKEQSNIDACEPTLVAATKNLGDKVEIRIRDNGYPQEITRALLNLISNGFYAATKTHRLDRRPDQRTVPY